MNERYDQFQQRQELEQAEVALVEAYLAHRLPGRDVQSMTAKEIIEMLGYLTSLLEREAQAVAAGGTYDPLQRYPLHRT